MAVERYNYNFGNVGLTTDITTRGSEKEQVKKVVTFWDEKNLPSITKDLTKKDVLVTSYPNSGYEVNKFLNNKGKWVTEVNGPISFRTGENMFLNGNLSNIAEEMPKMPPKVLVGFKKVMAQIAEVAKHIK